MLAFERVGSGEPLVLLHGVGHRRQAWYPVLDQLSDRREVFLLDLPGHGESDPLRTDRPVLDVLREELLGFLDAQGLDHPHMAGNSLGGRIALETALLGRARSVTALSPAGFWRSELAFVYTKNLFRTVEAVGRRIGARAPALIRTPAGRALMFGWINAKPGKVNAELGLGDLAGFQYAEPARHAVLAQASRFVGIPDVPVTIAWGTRDLVLPPYQARIARAQLPAARHLLLPGCGHVPMSDDPQLVARVLLRGSSVAV
jgi:pimeloyl-ACP methyl ester carboxylesterase